MTAVHSNRQPNGGIDAGGDSFLPLLVALVAMLLLAPLSTPVPLMFSLLASVVIFAGLLAVIRDRPFRKIALTALFVCLPLRWAAQFAGDRFPVLILLSHLTVAAYFAFLEAYVIVRVVAQPRITHHTVVGAICGYLLIGYVFAFVFAVVTFLEPGSIAAAGQALPAEQPATIEQRIVELFYFSFVTLATVGYGDIVAVSHWARSMAIVESLAGQLYLAAFVARLVGAMSAPLRNQPGD